MEYNFSEVERKWRQYWAKHETYKTQRVSAKPKYYVLDMFPYPSGSGLHVGHPLGYIASDIYARFKRHKGFNVLHPMGYDAFGLPAEQYAIQTGQHPALTTAQNIERYREQLDLIGFSFDWSRQVNTSNPDFYRWTQWIFVQLFHSWYNKKTDKAEPISTLIQHFEKHGNVDISAVNDEVPIFSASDWSVFSEHEKRATLLNYRIAYRAETFVNWCPALGTVLANDEVVNGLSERGGHPVEQKKMMQWSLRISAYAERLLKGLEEIDWPDSLKEIQKNWIGKSQGAEVNFSIQGFSGEAIAVFTTRPDTIFGATFLVLAPEHELIAKITTDEQAENVQAYVTYTKSRSERERMSETKKVTGAFTGAYAIHPLTDDLIPIWIADYVLAGYGTGAVMAVPSGDQRDWEFANHFRLPIIPVIDGQDVTTGADERKDGVLINSDFLNGLQVKAAIEKILETVASKGIGKRKVNYKLRDAVFSRQRYWGEPFPVYYRNDIPYTIDEDKLPLTLPPVDEFKPTEDGDPPLGRATHWNWDNIAGKLVETGKGHPIELSTMPGWAGSSWYFLRYMMEGDDQQRTQAFVSAEAVNYWKQIDLYMGGAEHATGHLLYFRFWTKFLHDLGYLPFDEPAKKLINQGMIQAEDGQKMSKRYGNIVNPDDVIAEHGADALRLHEMFLGPIEMHKPWNTKGIEGVSKFLRKLWRLFHHDNQFLVSEENPTKAELKALHKCIQKVTEDMDKFSFNTSVSAFMVAVNELTDLKCNKRSILEPLVVLVSCHAPHIAEELWEKLGHSTSISEVTWPTWDEAYLKDDEINYPVSFNGKTRFQLLMPADTPKEKIEMAALNHELTIKWLEGKTPKKVIVVPGRIVNIVL
jgi:leucyl-tRNA synthetase